MPYLGNEPAVAYTSTTKDTFSGDASTTDFTMSKSANVNAVRVVVENVVQNPTVAYTCSGTTLTFTSAPPSGTNNIYVVHLGPPAATIAPPTTINNSTTFGDGADIITGSKGTDNVRLGENAGNSITSGGTNNVTIGKNAGTAITTGDDNIAIGTSAGDALTTSEHNVAVGKEALSTETLGSYNTAIGTLALTTQNNSDIDVYNTAVGALAGRYITTGNQNSMFGAQAADALTTGQYNTALGYKALSLDTQGNRAVAVGYEALANQNYTSSSDNQNTAVGFHAGKEVTTGTENTFVGGEAGDACTVGNGNVAVGVQALSGDLNGSRSVAVGTTALKVTEASGTTSNNVYNVAVGYAAGLAVTTGYYNTIMGGLAADDMTTSVGNTVIGYQAGDDITTDCDYNVCIGYNAGDGLVSDGDYNVFVGGSTTTNASDSDNQIVMGYGVDSVGGGYITFGNNSGGRVYNHPYSNATWTRTSDERIKKDIQTNTDLGLNFINDLRTVTYKWKSPSEHPEEFVSYDAEQTEPKHTNKMYGFIAQEVKAAMDTHNITDFAGWHTVAGDGDQQGVSYEMFVMPLVKAVQELSAKVDALETENTAIKARLDALEAE